MPSEGESLHLESLICKKGDHPKIQIKEMIIGEDSTTTVILLFDDFDPTQPRLLIIHELLCWHCVLITIKQLSIASCKCNS